MDSAGRSWPLERVWCSRCYGAPLTLPSRLSRAEAAAHHLSPNRAFNVLHLRLEEDWLQHCARWETIPDGELVW